MGCPDCHGSGDGSWVASCLSPERNACRRCDGAGKVYPVYTTAEVSPTGGGFAVALSNGMGMLFHVEHIFPTVGAAIRFLAHNFPELEVL